ncbi:hypothetical protein QLQ12_35085 [Actinoplanes sp. NEAU-A12]|uniref:Uncharacterized protein n=1 Tax=Actinoplanes sandaracinus TaxID=3045177 RepID=A0ABT6WVT6_9ACTN|nr:hypothetical protein [Actinoplanes sandaracinus]MDI6103853.1 hypothetical protein [Actinoplanes sandaracinus]
MIIVTRVVVRPYAQIVLLLPIFGMSGMYGVVYLTDGSLARRDWFSVGIGLVFVPASLVGAWWTIRLGATLDVEGIHIRGRVDGRDEFLPGPRADLQIMNALGRQGVFQNQRFLSHGHR